MTKLTNSFMSAPAESGKRVEFFDRKFNRLAQ
jgi:hypothetical protein